MNKGNLNKLVTNYPVELTEKEIANLSGTLAPVIAACGGGGGGTGGKIYTGIGFVTVNNSTNQIGLTEAANTKLNQDIPTKVSDLTDSANYQTVAGMDEYLTTANAQTLYQTKDDMSAYWTSAETIEAFAEQYSTLVGLIDGKQDKLTFGYDSNDKISAINSSALAGQGGTTYSAGQYINIDANDTISVTGVLALDEYAQYEPVLIGDSNITATSSKVDSHTQWNLAVNAHPTVTDTTLTGKNGIYTHTTPNSGEWCVELVQSAYDAIDSVGGITTDVGTLKTASAGWDKVSDKLDTTAFSTVSGNFLTAHQSLDDYATKTDISDMATQTWVGQQGFYTKASGDNDYAPKSVTSTVNTLTAASASWNEVSAKLGTAQYALDSATFVTSSSNTITGTKQYALTTAGWAVVQAGTSFTGVTTTGSISGGGVNNDTIGLLTSAENALTAIANKVDKPADLTSNTPYCFSGGQWADLTQTYYSKSEATGTFLQKNLSNTLSGDGTSNNTLGVNWSNLSANLINSANTASNAWISGTEFSSFAQIKTAIDSKQSAGDYLYTSGGTVSGSTYFSAASGQNLVAVASAASLIGASRQTSANFGQNNDAMGTTWMGVGGPGMYRGFLKYTQGGNVGALDSNNTMQVEFTPNDKGTIFAKAKNNGTDCPETQILNPTRSSCSSMQTSGIDANNMSGPNYMIAKNADGQFVIGAAVFNCQGSLPGTLQPNTYYFVY